MGDIVRVVRRGRFIGWYVRYKDADGTRRQRASHQPTKELARRYLLEVEGRIARGVVGIPEPAPPAPPLAAVVERFLGEYSRARVKDLPRYRQAARLALQRAVAVLGELPIHTIKPDDINQLRLALGTRYAAATVRVTLAFLATVFGWAVRQGITPSNPLKGVERPTAESLIEYLTKQECAALLRLGAQQASAGDLAAKARHACVHFAIHTGLRKGELMGLRWLDIDLQTRRLSVARSYKTTPKSGKARHLRLPLSTVPVLTAWRHQCPPTPQGLVFPVRKRGQFVAGKATDMLGMHELLAQACCRRMARPWHCLRHTFASHFVMSGGNILTLQKILGHCNIAMTLAYAHLAPDFLGDEMDRLQF